VVFWPFGQFATVNRSVQAYFSLQKQVGREKFYFEAILDSLGVIGIGRHV
jgi:hypothetical protein